MAGQDIELIEGTILQNIALADSEAAPTDIEEAARIAGLSALIEDLPKGYQTWIGQQGLNLSGGQRQRIGIARAILRDPQLLILDEAMNAIDVTLEDSIRSALKARFARRTVLVITHRLESVRDADHIICIGEGRVLAQGSFQELITNPQSLLARTTMARQHSPEGTLAMRPLPPPRSPQFGRLKAQEPTRALASPCRRPQQELADHRVLQAPYAPVAVHPKLGEQLATTSSTVVPTPVPRLNACVPPRCASISAARTCARARSMTWT